MVTFSGSQSVSKIIAIVSILSGTAALSWGYLSVGYWLAALGIALLGMIWLVTHLFALDWFSSWALLFKVAAAAVGIWLGLSPILVVFAVISGLIAWDLSAFQHRLRSTSPTDDISTIESRHLVWLGLMGGVSLLMSTSAGLVEFQFSFSFTLLLAFIAVLGIAQLVAWLRH